MAVGDGGAHYVHPTSGVSHGEEKYCMTLVLAAERVHKPLYTGLASWTDKTSSRGYSERLNIASVLLPGIF